MDSFDHYNDTSTKWFIGGGAVDLTGTLSRTGIGCMDLAGSTTGPFLLFNGISRFVSGTAFYLDNFPQPTFGEIMNFIETVTNTRQVRIVCYPDCSIGVLNENTVLGRSAPGQLVINSYNYIEVDAIIATLGACVVRVNEQVVLNLNNVRTQFPGSLSLVNAWRLKGFGITASTRHDDVYLRDPDGETFGQSFWGAEKTFAIVPDADAAPLNWTPSSGTDHFSLVNEIPPDNGATYVESNTVNQKDQYSQSNSAITNPLATSIPCVQHCLCMADPAVTRSVGSCADGAIEGNQVLTDAFLIYNFPYERSWTVAAVGSTKFGPVVTA